MCIALWSLVLVGAFLFFDSSALERYGRSCATSLFILFLLVGCERKLASTSTSGHVLGPRSGGTTGAALGQRLGLSSMASATGP